MKRKMQYVLVTLLIMIFFPLSANASLLKHDGVLLKLNNSYILYSQQEMPYIDHNGRILIPLRMVGELMEAKVSWNGKKQNATIAFDNVKAILTIGKKEALVNEKSYLLDTTAVLRNKSTMIPARFIADILGIPVNWDAKYRVLTLKDERFLKAPIFSHIDDMQDLDKTFKGKIVPRNVRFIKSKNPELNRVTIEITNVSDSVIYADQLHKNLYFYRNENSAGGDMSFGISSPQGKLKGYNPKDIARGGNFLDYSYMPYYKISKDSVIDTIGEVKYIICNYFKIVR